MSMKRIAIVGAGIAGLTAALALSRRGIACDIIERAVRLQEVGAGLQVSPNASRILAELGILQSLEPSWNEPDRIALSSGLSLRDLAHVPVGRFARERWGAPYGVLHRATLQRALLSAVEQQPLCRLHLGVPLDNPALDVVSAITHQPADLVIGADGVWSKVRGLVPGAPAPIFSGNIAWRLTVASPKAPPALKANAVTAFLGPGAHLVSYPLGETGSFNVVAISTGPNPGQTWQADASARHHDLLLRQFAAWHPQIRALLAEAADATFWPLCEVTRGRWHNGGKVVLIGDAAHAMMPFAAQGASMAIEDAARLADHLTRAGTIADRLNAFEQERTARVDRVRARGAFNRFVYHARGPARLARNFALSMRSPQSLAGDFDWLYGFDAADP
ncbi:FAD-dependent monooxygenase [Neorhizobium sp. NPDC001467]|uniref:FAD-dependent monooxygenase n=1 Tax=Neorhizobium sp. NPDC001467 TaxID=3390595 RepID=UPI003CFE5830